MSAERLMVIIPDRITEILVKGEYQPNYYNPGELFDEVHIVTTTDDRPDLTMLQRTVGRARLAVHNLPEQPQLISGPWRRWWKKPLRDWARPGVALAGQIRPQLVRCHGADWNMYLASRIRTKLHVPYVASLHINPDVNPVRRFVTTPLTAAQRNHNAFFDYIEGTGLRAADLVMPVYEPIVPYLQRHGVTRIEVCYNILNGRHLRAKTSYQRGTPFRIVCVGRLIREKKPDRLIEAVAQLPGVELTVVGDGPERERLQALAERAAPGRIIFRPAVPNDELCAMLPSFDMFAVHTEYWELNKSVLEALLTGLPLVMNHRESGPPVPELAGADFIRFVSNTADGYRDAIHQLMMDDDQREALGRRAYAHAQARWAPARTEEKVVQVYRRFMRPAA
jgi:glycosyltransferase involved in cell wall biosynthesis